MLRSKIQVLGAAYITSLLGFDGDTSGELTCTLDDASERRTKDGRENAGVVPT